MKLDLKDVTICAVDSVNVALTARALHESMAQCDFADAILFSHAPVAGTFRMIAIDEVRSTAEYSNVVLKRLPALIETPFVLIVQWDGYVTNPAAWSPAFREYDYIGARWLGVTDGMSVGNGGFSLRSRRFLSAMSGPRFPIDKGVSEDWLFCRDYRPALEQEFGVRFATEEIADMFSYENIVPWKPPFGFHGMGNMCWHVEDAEMVELVDHVAPYVCRTHHYVQLLLEYFKLNKPDPLRALYSKLKAHVGGDEAVRLMEMVALNKRLVRRCVRMCERLLPPA